jgi:hypothetical protein
MFRTDFLSGSSLHTADTVIGDYEDIRRRPAAFNQRQQGDPAKAARRGEAGAAT